MNEHGRIPPLTPEAWQAIAEELSLSDRQAAISYLLMTGLSDRQIALKLKIKVPTVRTHISRLYLKTGVQDRVEFILHGFSRICTQCRSSWRT